MPFSLCNSGHDAEDRIDRNGHHYVYCRVCIRFRQALRAHGYSTYDLPYPWKLRCWKQIACEERVPFIASTLAPLGPCPNYVWLTRGATKESEAARDEWITKAGDMLQAAIDTEAKEKAREKAELRRANASKRSTVIEPLPTPQPVPGSTLIRDLQLPVRAYNCLLNAGLQFAYEVCRTRDAEFLSVKNLGKKSLAEIRRLCPFDPTCGEGEVPNDVFADCLAHFILELQTAA